MPVKWVFDTWSNQKDINPNDQTSWNMNVFTTYALRWTLGDLNINIIPKNRYQVLLNWFQPYQTPMLKNADYVKKTTYIFVPVCCNYILSKYLMGLNYRKFLFRTLCWSSYEDEVLYQLFEVQTDRPGYFVTSISIN